MILKSEEAKKLYCPWCFASQEGDTSIKCEAEKCMAWSTSGELEDNRGYCQLIEKHD